MLMAGPLPQARLKAALGLGVSICSPASAGIVSLASPSRGCPGDVPGCASAAQPGKLSSIWLVVSAGVSLATPPSPIVTSRVPEGLVTLIFVGAAAKPKAGSTLISEIRRARCQLTLITGFGDPDIHGVLVFGLNRLSGPNSGRSPQVELALTSRADLSGRVSLPSRVSSPAPGWATADAVTASRSGTGRVKSRASGTVAARSATPAGAGGDWWKENATADADSPAALSSAGSR